MVCIDYIRSFSCTDRYTYAVVDGRALQRTVEKEESAAAVSRVTAQPKMPSPATRVIGSIVKGRDLSSCPGMFIVDIQRNVECP